MSNNNKSDLVIYGRLLKYVIPMWAMFLFSVLGFSVFSGVQVLLADMMQLIVDYIGGNMVPGEGGMSAKLMWALGGKDFVLTDARLWIVLMMVVLGLVRGLGYFAGNYFIAIVSNSLVHNLRCELFNKMLHMPSRYFDQNSTGMMISKITFNVEQVTGAAVNATKVVLREGTFAIGLIAYLLYSNWKLTMVFFLALPIIAVTVYWVGKRFRKLSKNIQNAMSDVNQVTNESIGAYREIRLYDGTAFETARFVEASGRTRSQNIKMAYYNAISPSVIQFPVVLATGVLIWIALGLGGSMSPGAFVAYLSAALFLPKPMRQLADVSSTIQKGLAAAEDIFDFIDAEQEKDEGTYRSDVTRGDIEIRNLNFAYSPDSELVLRNINLKVEAGKSLALVGLSGSGKSTLVSLLSRFYEHDQGDILLDGVDVRDYQLSNLRDKMALVTQQVTLFNDTVFNNIAYGKMAGASREEVRAAIEAAHASEFIDQLPLGLETVIGEDGVMLSGGQRQRLAIARAFLKNAPILIFDEATSALDNRAESHIQKAMEEVMKGRTTIVIAHRLSTIEMADQIVVMEAGQIKEQGSHDELLALNQRYAQLYHKNFEE
ncbi:transport protein MsbA [gamma proteobacterium BDW918]|jgi:subfamily B ATP-binding cassette protein MsbA|uniref:Lipid ABC transporter permease/ATP-binding protein n=1 Tax=Zhongshania aliphaticivorans TaxID=1470434 RepID=A0A127M4X7_9GAMM|nr:lipid A export permease/ATP-binding protein MsbA [Zhongshania aliphaticivorans]AMO68241.1 lipid ABC transporter permease/ATP-binding protein [Zhongshania aliphaticivorans]EIF44354.1 transport protein MsbA [gamma proteobacterium BDW918]